MAIKGKHIAIPASLAGIVTVALLSGGPRVPMDLADPSAMLTSQPQAAVDVIDGSFGSAQALNDGIKLTMSEPEIFEPSDPDILGIEGRPQLLTITVVNASKESLDLGTFAVVETLLSSAPDETCLDAFDPDAGVVGVPWEPIAPGAEVSFTWVIVCPAPEGDTLEITVAITEGQQVTFRGRLA
jgi:hypothetical protein